MPGSVLAYISYHPIVHVHIGPLSISPHGVGIAVGFLLGARLMLPAANRAGIRDEQVYALLTRAAIGAIVGARLAYVLNHLGDYSSVTEVFKVWHGGISLLGGFVGAILLALPKMRSVRLRKTRRYDGFLIFLFAVWYGSMRIVEDFLREDVRHFGLTGSQWSSILIVALCLGALLFLRRTPRWGRWDEPPASPAEPVPE